jgi:hypothetical protein
MSTDDKGWVTRKDAAATRGVPTRGSRVSTGMVNHYYFYCVDEDFGPFFIRFCSYFPYNAKLCLLTELREESSQRRRQLGVCVATVPDYEHARRSVTGSALTLGMARCWRGVADG